MSNPATLLREWRLSEGIGPKDAGVRVGVDRITWWRWESGKSRVAIERLERVHAETGIPSGQLRPDLVAAVGSS